MEKINNELYRHGDVWIRRVKQVEKRDEPKQVKSVKLALGEATGHSHDLSVPDGAMLTFWGKDGDVAGFELPTEGTLIHNEHNMLQIDPGVYEINREREHDYFSNEIRRVAD